jgi:hypothetical protein
MTSPARSESEGRSTRGKSKTQTDRKPMLLRVDPQVHAALAKWAADDLRSTNAHVEWLLRQALTDAGRLPPTRGTTLGVVPDNPDDPPHSPARSGADQPP